MTDALRRQLTRRLVAANVLAGLLVLAYFDLTITPTRRASTTWQVVVSLLGYIALVIVIVPLTVRRVRHRYLDRMAWWDEGREPSEAERVTTLELPWRLTRVALRAWLAAAAAIALSLFSIPQRALSTFVGVLLGGLTAAALTFLLVEQTLRPTFALALARDDVPAARSISVRQRFVLAWGLGSGVPLLGVALTPLVRGTHAGLSIAVPIVFLALVGMWAGLGITLRAAASVAEPLDAVRSGLSRVEDGDLAGDIPVDDSGEIGRLQRGFNQMVAGLRERARLHDLFGRHVGEEVARQALAHGVELGGEQRDMTALFVDLVNSTALTDQRSPSEVVEVLNEFFAAVFESVSGEGGWVNKFEGDGALCVFGAPSEQPDHAARALRAARTLRDRLNVLELVAGIGVSSGVVVAGNVGAEERYEYTVIGRPVHEAARVCELAKQRPCHLLATAATVHGAAPAPDGWVSAGSVELRGFAQPTAVYEA